MMANDRSIDEDTLFEPERLAARAIDWDQIDRGHSSGRAATSLQHRRRIHGRNQDYANINRKSLAPQEPSIHGSRNQWHGSTSPREGASATVASRNALGWVEP
jgi:hypothetical protein